MAAGDRRHSSDSIAAIATPPGRGAIGIVRVSGPAAYQIARSMTRISPRPRQAHNVRFHDGHGAVIDRGIVIYFAGPRSYTGEDVVEFQAHGSPAVLNLLMERAFELGARPARPGEFTERAFLNGKLDLTQAEAVADVINSVSAQAARAAQASLQGDFSARVHEVIGAIDEFRSETEARLDFPEEGVEESAGGDRPERIRRLTEALSSLAGLARRGTLLQDGIRVAIAGRPNAGKSSLLNRLARAERAIVSPLPGTTRDTVNAEVLMEGVPVSLTDTAGLRDDAEATEREGIRRARETLHQADHILLVLPCDEPWLEADREVLACKPAGAAITVVRNKIDLCRGLEPGIRLSAVGDAAPTEVLVSAKEDLGIDLVEQRILEAAGGLDAVEGACSARRRHAEALNQALSSLSAAAELAPELLAEQLRLARQQLQTITGEFTTEDLLDDIFRKFCIGK